MFAELISSLHTIKFQMISHYLLSVVVGSSLLIYSY